MPEILFYRVTLDPRTRRPTVTEGAELGAGVIVLGVPRDMPVNDVLPALRALFEKFASRAPSLARRRL